MGVGLLGSVASTSYSETVICIDDVEMNYCDTLQIYEEGMIDGVGNVVVVVVSDKVWGQVVDD